MIRQYICPMPKANLQQCVEVFYEKTDKCPFREKPYLFFQIVYIISGTGKLNLNENCVEYGAGKLYLISPQDKHHFNIEQTSEFLLIRFTHAFVKEYRWKTIDHVESLLHHATHLTGCIMKSESDRFLVKRIIESIIHTIQNKDQYNEDLIFHFVSNLIVIAARNIVRIKPAQLTANADNKIQEIISYIQSHINDPEKLRAPAIGKAFGIAETYLGSYFKQQTGETLQHYISNYKLRLIEHRLRFSDMRINEIAVEFGFTDDSHLNKFFKKYRGISLTEYRKANTSQRVSVVTNPIVHPLTVEQK